MDTLFTDLGFDESFIETLETQAQQQAEQETQNAKKVSSLDCFTTSYEAQKIYNTLGLGVVALKSGSKVPAFHVTNHTNNIPGRVTHRSIIVSKFPKQFMTGKNIGVVMGRGVMCIDVDLYHWSPKQIKAWNNLLFDKGNSWMQISANGGEHYFYILDPDIPSTNNLGGINIDIKGLGGYIVACPSKVLRRDGVTMGDYSWVRAPDTHALTIMPDQLKQFLLSFQVKAAPKITATKEEAVNEPEKFTDHEIETLAPKLLKELKQSRVENYDSWIKVGLILKYKFGDQGLPLWNTWSQRSAKFEPDICEEKWFHPSFVPHKVTFGSLVHYHREDNPEPIITPKAPVVKVPAPFILPIRQQPTQPPASLITERYTIPLVKNYGLMWTTLVVLSAMGTGKTEEMLRWIAQEKPKVVRIISFRQSYTDNAMKKYNPPGTPEDERFHDYREEANEKSTGQISAGINRVIVQYESLYRIPTDPDSLPDLLILDEPEQILNQLNNIKGQKGHERLNWAHFEWLLKYSKKVIVLDATADTRTWKLLERHRPDFIVHVNEHKIPKAVTVWEHQLSMEGKILADVRDGKKLIIPTNCKSFADDIHRQLVAQNPAIRIKTFSSESDAGSRAELSDVNASWSQYDVVLYTSTVSAAISFTTDHFDSLYAFFINMSNGTKTCLQMLGRARAINHYNIHVKNTPYNGLRNIEEVEQYICDNSRLKEDKELNIQNIPVTINKNGKYEYLHKDGYYHAVINNSVEMETDRANFMGRLLGLLEAAGATVSVESTLDTFGHTTERARDVRVQLRAERSAIISTAVTICSAAAHDMSLAKQTLSSADRASLTQYNLCETFELVGKPTVAQVTTYNVPAVKSTWHNVKSAIKANTLVESRKEVARELIARVDKRPVDRSSFDDLNDNWSDNKERVLIGLDILGKLGIERMSEIWNKTLTPVEYTIGMDSAFTYIGEPHNRVLFIGLLAGYSKVPIRNWEANTTKQKTRFIKNILKKLFDIRILSVKSHHKIDKKVDDKINGKVDQYVFASSKLFTLDMPDDGPLKLSVRIK